MAKLTRAEVRARAMASAKRQENVAKVRAERQDIRQDLKGRHDSAPGTSPAALGAVKAASEEAAHVTCSECGSSGGRHARMCSRG